MKKILYLSIIFCALFCFGGICALADEGDDADTYYVTLDAAGGSISGEDSTEISQAKYDFQDIDLSEYVPEKDGFTFTGWYNKSKKVSSIKSSDFADDANRLTITAMYTKNSFSGAALTFTLNANGGTIGDGESGTYDFDVAGSSYGIALADYTPVRKGYTFTGWNTSADGSGKNVTMIYNSDFEKAGDNGYDYSDPDDDSAKRNLTFYAQWDGAKLSGKITIGKKSWDSVQDGASFDTYYKKAVNVSISAAKGLEVGYIISSEALSEDSLAGSTFTKYGGAFTVGDDGSYIIYAQIKSGDNSIYVSSEGFTIDTEAPVFDGITDGDVYCSSVTASVSDANLDKLTVNGKEVSPDENGAFKLSPANSAQEIIATDKAGNKSKITVTVNKNHVADEDDHDCTTPTICKYCGKEMVKAKSEHKLSTWKSNGDGTHTSTCQNKGCDYTVTKDCSGGKATCTEKAVCSTCGAKYGDMSKTNHTALKKVDYTAATASSNGNIEYWYCSACGKYFSDKKCTKSIKKEDTVISKEAPKIIDGNGSKWKKSDNDTLTFRSDADLADFVCVLVDSNVISSSYYTKSEGSTIIELKASYLSTLSAGSHSLIIRSTTGDAVANFTIEGKKKTTTEATTKATTEATTKATTEATTKATTEATTENTTTAPMVTTETTTTTTTQYTTQTTTSTTQSTTESTTSFYPFTTERTTTEYTMHEYTTRARKISETTTEVTTERSAKRIDNYKASDTVDKRKNRVRNLQLIILITVLATILVSFVVILISGRKK